jgi:hypothetical protein
MLLPAAESGSSMGNPAGVVVSRQRASRTGPKPGPPTSALDIMAISVTDHSGSRRRHPVCVFFKKREASLRFANRFDCKCQ